MRNQTMNMGTKMVAALLLSASACALDVASGAVPNEKPALPGGREGGHQLRASDDGLIDKVTFDTPVILSQQSEADIYRDSSGPGSILVATDKAIVSANTHVCFLAGVIGDLYTSSYVELKNTTLGGENIWMLNTSANGNSLAGEAVCVPWWSFIVDDEPDSDIWYSSSVTASAGGGCLGRSKEVTVAPDNLGVGYLSTVFGQFEGGEEYGQVTQSATAPHPYKLRVHTKQCGSMRASAFEFFAGRWSIGTRRTQIYSVSSNGTKRVKLWPTETTVCYLTRVSGNMDGAPEKVRIFPEFDSSGREWWILEAAAGGGSAYGSAQCVFYDQRESSIPPIN